LLSHQQHNTPAKNCERNNMKSPNVVVSLPGENRYLMEQTAAAQAAARRLGVNLRVLNAHSEPVAQSQQLLEVIQAPTASRPAAVIVEPAAQTGLPRVAEAAVAAGVGWVVSNARVDYMEHLRRDAKAPVFCVSQDHSEIGRMQGKQIGALLPAGGTVLYLRGPASNYLACQRAEGVESAIPSNVRTKTLKIQWTEENCFKSVSAWMRLSTGQADEISLISSQNTDFVLGARRAFDACANIADRMKWLRLPYTGAGTTSLIKPLVDKGVLTAAVMTSLTMDTALEILVRAMKSSSQPPELTFVQASSFPSLEDLGRRGAARLPMAAGAR
jgi:ABC-type sugar transport system substrate-binding protein